MALRHELVKICVGTQTFFQNVALPPPYLCLSHLYISLSLTHTHTHTCVHHQCEHCALSITIVNTVCALCLFLVL
jgi:hypothetical protein